MESTLENQFLFLIWTCCWYVIVMFFNSDLIIPSRKCPLFLFFWQTFRKNRTCGLKCCLCINVLLDFFLVFLVFVLFLLESQMCSDLFSHFFYFSSICHYYELGAQQNLKHQNGVGTICNQRSCSSFFLKKSSFKWQKRQIIDFPTETSGNIVGNGENNLPFHFLKKVITLNYWKQLTHSLVDIQSLNNHLH